MACNIECFFIHKDSLNLSVDQIRDFGFLVAETTTHYLEISQFNKKEQILQQLERFDPEKNDFIYNDYFYDEYEDENENEDSNNSEQKELFNIIKPLLAYKKENTVPFMFYRADSFGGMFDNLELFIFEDENNIKEYCYDDFQEVSSLYFNCVDFFEVVSFNRDSGKVLSNKQQIELDSLRLMLEETQYKVNKAKFLKAYPTVTTIDSFVDFLIDISGSSRFNNVLRDNIEFSNPDFLKRFKSELTK